MPRRRRASWATRAAGRARPRKAVRRGDPATPPFRPLVATDNQQPEATTMESDQYFEQVATQWDAMREAFFSERLREKAFAAAGLRPGTSAADVGAGTGFLAEGLLARGVRVVAVDRSPAKIGRASCRARV